MIAPDNAAMSWLKNMQDLATAWAIVAIAIALAGCAGAAAHHAASSPASRTLPDRARAVIRYCPELACTTAAGVPGCAFSENVEQGNGTVRADIECAREGTATACEERRTPEGGENQNLQAERLDFRCSGNPLTCVVTGGNAVWPAPALATESSLPSGGAISCPAPRSSPPHSPHRIPGPYTG